MGLNNQLATGEKFRESQMRFAVLYTFQRLNYTT